MSEPMKFIWLVWGTRGEYSDRDEWPIAAYTDESSAQAAVVALKNTSRALYAVFKAEEDSLELAGDWEGASLLDTTEEGRRWVELSGSRLTPGSYDFDEMEFSVCEIPLRKEQQE